MLLLGVPGVLSGIVDNIPYVATMSPVVEELVATETGSASPTVLWWALALGADLGWHAVPMRTVDG